MQQSSYPDEGIEDVPEKHPRSDAKSKIKVTSGELSSMIVRFIANKYRYS